MLDISKALGIRGWMAEDELTWLAEQASNCGIVVEFGCHLGRSTRALGDHVIEKVFAVDPWEDKYYDMHGNLSGILGTNQLGQFNTNLYDLILDGKVVPQQIKSTDFHYSYPVDMVFIDGDHRYEEVKKDIFHAMKLIKPGGLICGHDWDRNDWPGVTQAVKEIFPNANVGIINSIWSINV